MYLTLSLLAAVLITILTVSKVAKMLHAKRFDFGWIVLASVTSGIVALLASFGLGLFVEGLDPMVMLGLTLAVMFIVSSAAFKFINQMSWGGAITTNIANMVIGVAGLTAAIVLNGGSLTKTINDLNITAKKNTAVMESVAHGDMRALTESGIETAETGALPEDEVMDDDGLEPLVTELDLLPKGTVAALKKKEQKIYTEPRYQVVNISSIRSLVGKSVKIHKKSDKIFEGTLKRVSGNNAVINLRIGNGYADTPISLATIRKLEVYK
jgi:hypothetical protein